MAITTLQFPQTHCEIEIKDQYRAHRPLIAKEWPEFDRVFLTEKQAIDLVERVSDTAYFSSATLEKPSIPEFTAVIQDDGRLENTYVMYRCSIMDPEDFEVLGQLKDSLSLTPLVDAFVYANNSGILCNCVITLCKAVLTARGKTLPTTMHLVTYTHDDPMTKYMTSQAELMQRFAQTVKAVYMGVQMLSLERPEVVAAETVHEEYSGTVKKKGRYKAVRKTRMVKVIRLSDDAVKPAPKTRHEMTCPCWGVAGHTRTYKSGKQVWIRPYRKGKRRNDPAAYQPKQYEIPKEDTV